MIYPIATPPYPDLGPASWWEMLIPSSPVYWFVFAGVLISLGYAAWVIVSAIKARNAEPTASFVSIACFERVMANARPDGVRHYLVQTHKGFPDIEQFEPVLPKDETSFRISYRNEVHGYTFRLVRREEDGAFDVFILKAPRYEGQPADEASSFRAGIGTPRERIAFAPRMQPTNLADCVRKAIFWAESNSQYIMTGTRWVKQAAPQSPQDARQDEFAGHEEPARQPGPAKQQVNAARQTYADVMDVEEPRALPEYPSRPFDSKTAAMTRGVCA